MDPNRIEEKITTRTRLIIAQHTYGYPADMDAILDISRRRGVPVIEDCCLSLGSTYRGKVTGSFAQAAYFSFQWNKPYTTGLGGMALVADNDVAKRMGEVCEREAMNPNGAETNMLRAQLAVYRSLIYPSTTALAQNVFRLLGNVGLVVASSKASEKTTAMEPDFFKRMSAMQARAGMRQLGKLERNRAHRRRMRKRYDVLLAEHDWVVPQLPDAIDPVLVRYPVRVDDKARALRDASRHFVELGSWFECPLHPMETELSLYGYHTGMCPEADKACREVVNLPCHPRVSERTARRCVRFITALRREQMQ
jgi:dTDP-4-amino-4,6-dideoxygalactose transaminase